MTNNSELIQELFKFTNQFEELLGIDSHELQEGANELGTEFAFDNFYFTIRPFYQLGSNQEGFNKSTPDEIKEFFPKNEKITKIIDYIKQYFSFNVVHI